MKKIKLALCAVLLLIFMFSLTGCGIVANLFLAIVAPNDINEYNGMQFWLIQHEDENGKDYYYMAGNLVDKEVVNYFMPMEINGYPVRKFGYTRFMNTSAGTISLNEKALQKLYMPGTIAESGNDYSYLEYIHRSMQIYYCGEVINLCEIYPYDAGSIAIDYYVPANRYDDFENVFGTTSYKPVLAGLHKANIAYRLNSEDMCEYYYVDNIEAGNKIENIPPEPTRKGYTFGGWYTEKECVNKWDFDNIPTVSDNEETFVEFSLYAKWIKK